MKRTNFILQVFILLAGTFSLPLTSVAQPYTIDKRILLPPSKHPWQIKGYQSFYDVNQDGILEVVGNSNDHKNCIISSFKGEIISSKDEGFYATFSRLDNTGTIYCTSAYSYAPWNNLNTIKEFEYQYILGDINGDGLADFFPTDKRGASIGNYLYAYIQQSNGEFAKKAFPVTRDTIELNTMALSNYTTSTSGCALPVTSLSEGMFVKSRKQPATEENPTSRSIAGDNDGTFYGQTYLKDMNGDGLLDIVTNKSIYYNLGNGKFFQSGHIGKIYSADINGDGKLDYIDANETVRLHITTPNGKLGDGQELFSNTTMQNVFFGDFDQDGDVDLLFFIPTSDATYLTFYRNDGNGKFKRKETYLNGEYFSYSCKDYDGDGLYEIAVSTGDDKKKDYLIKCNLKNVSATLIKLNTTNENKNYDVIIGDFDNDGIMEYGYTTFIPNFIYDIIPNCQKNTRPEKMSTPIATYFADADKLKISWTKGTDAQTSSCDLTYELRIGTQPGKGDILFANSNEDGTRRCLFEGNMGRSQNYIMNTSHLKAGKYYISVQAIDAGGLGGAWSDEFVYVHNDLSPVIEASANNIATTDTLQLNILRPMDNAIYTWNIGNGKIIKSSEHNDTIKVMFDTAGKFYAYAGMELDGEIYKSKTKEIEVTPFNKDLWDSLSGFENILDINQDGTPEVFDDALKNVDKKGNITTIKKSFNTDLRLCRLTPYDFNKDGYLDFMIERSSKNVYINSGEQDCEFEYKTDATFSKYYFNLVDFNNDGNWGGQTDNLYDFNRDGAWDTWKGNNYPYKGDVFLKENNGKADFSYIEVENKCISLYKIQDVADFNNDGYPDYLVYDDFKKYYIIKGKPISEWPCSEIVASFSEGVKVINDLDNNGYIDLMTSERYSYDCNLYLMQPNFKFVKLKQPQINNSESYIANYTNQYKRIEKETLWQPLYKGGYPNGWVSNIKNKAPEAPANIRAYMTDKGLQLEWDDAKDDHTPWAQMRYNVSVKYKNKKVGEENAFLISPLNGLKDKATITSKVFYRKATRMLIPTSSLKSGETYEVQIQSIDLMGEHSPMSKVTEITVYTDGYLETNHKYFLTGSKCEVKYVGTQASNFNIKLSADATIESEGKGTYEISWKEPGKKFIEMEVDGKTYQTQVYTIDRKDQLGMTFPNKVMRYTPIKVKVPKIFNNTELKKCRFESSYKYRYTPGDSVVTFTFDRPGMSNVAVTASLEEGLSFYNRMDVNVVDEIMPTPEITSVVAEGKNYRLSWNKEVPSMVNRVEILRESNSLDQFEAIDTVSVSAGSYLDKKSDNRIKSQRYRIRLLADNNMQTSECSEVHQPVHLAIYKATNKKEYNLQWNAYEGMNIEGYQILRGTTPDNMEVIAQVAGTQQYYTDASAPSGTNYYAIAFTSAKARQLSRVQAVQSDADECILSNAISTSEAVETITGESLHISSLEGNMSIYEPSHELHLIATILPTSASSTNIKWSIVGRSGDVKAMISPTGVLTGIDGTGTIVVRVTAMDGSGIYAEATIDCRCSTSPTDFDIYTPTYILKVGEQVKLTGKITPEFSSCQEIIWETIDPEVATIDNNGVVTGISVGKARIIACPKNKEGKLAAQIFLSVEESSGINNITMDDTRTTKYFDLEGRSVQTPKKGHLYITNKGKKVVF